MAVNTAVGTTTWNIKTNDFNGYSLTVKASTSPAMKSTTTAAVIPDYTPASATVPELWSVSNAVESYGSSITKPPTTGP